MHGPQSIFYVTGGTLPGDALSYIERRADQELYEALPQRRFRLIGESAGITYLTARLYLAKLSDGIAGSEIEAESTAASDTGNTFRYSGGHYQFNLGTRTLSEGTWRMRIDLGDGVVHTVDFSLRS